MSYAGSDSANRVNACCAINLIAYTECLDWSLTLWGIHHSSRYETALVQADGFDVVTQEVCADVAVHHTLVIGDKKRRVGGHRLGVGAHILNAHPHRRAILERELMAHAQRRNNQAAPTRAAIDLA